MAKTFFNPMTIGLMALGGVGFMVWKNQQDKEMVKGGAYRITARGAGDEYTNWKSLAKELERGAATSEVFIKGKGATRTVEFIIRPQGPIKARPGEPMFQIQGVNIILQNVTPLGAVA